MEEEISGYYYVIPSEIMWNNNIKDKSKLLYCVIANLCNKNGVCFASNDYLSKIFNSTDRTIKSLISELYSNGFINIELVDNNKRIITIPRKIISQGGENNFIGGGKNFPTNNNSIIIKNNNKENIYKESEEIINYLNSKTGFNYKSKIQNTCSLINARIKEGFTIEDFKKVIDNKCNDWLNDSNMRKYLRPQTLFGTKFENYLNQESNVRVFRIGVDTL